MLKHSISKQQLISKQLAVALVLELLILEAMQLEKRSQSGLQLRQVVKVLLFTELERMLRESKPSSLVTLQQVTVLKLLHWDPKQRQGALKSLP